jgi:hypothetical protein
MLQATPRRPESLPPVWSCGERSSRHSDVKKCVDWRACVCVLQVFQGVTQACVLHGVVVSAAVPALLLYIVLGLGRGLFC